MKFLKNFFNDDSVIVGLCAFEEMRPKYFQDVSKNQFFFNPYQFETNLDAMFEENVLL